MAVTVDAGGWTTVTPSSDSRIVYVSSSTGNDANDGLSEATPKATIAAAKSLLRDGMPDHLLLKRGDTWTITSSISFSKLDGRSADDPILIGAYGSGDRPKIDSGDGRAFDLINTRHLVMMGLQFTPTRSEQESSAVLWISTTTTGGSTWVTDDILIEDVRVDGSGVTITSGSGETTDVTVRRSIITNAWSTTSHAQGLYSDGVDGLLIEENLFDHNGWSESVEGAQPTQFNHSMYITHYTRNATIRNNISSRASSMGLKFQPNDGTHYITGNVFVKNGYGIQIGGGQASKQIEGVGATIYANENTVIEGDVSLAGGGMGVTVSNVQAGSFNNNIIANKLGEGNQFAMSLQDGMGWETAGIGVQNFEIDGNTIYNWRGQVQVVEPTQSYGSRPIPEMKNIAFTNNLFQEPGHTSDLRLLETFDPSSSVNSFDGNSYFSNLAAQQWFRIESTSRTYTQWLTETGEPGASARKLDFIDPTRTVTTYAAALGYESYDEFMEAAKQQSRQNWNPQLTADAINDYIRAGFEHDPIGVTPLPSPAPPSSSSYVPSPNFAPNPDAKLETGDVSAPTPSASMVSPISIASESPDAKEGKDTLDLATTQSSNDAEWSNEERLDDEVAPQLDDADATEAFQQAYEELDSGDDSGWQDWTLPLGGL